MRRLSAIGLVLALLLAAASARAAAPPTTRAPIANRNANVGIKRGPIAKLSQKTVQLARKKISDMKLTLNDPARRHLVWGSTAVMFTGMAASVLIDGALMSIALPPLAHIVMGAVVSPLLSNALPTVGQHFMQQRLHMKAPAYFAAEPDMTGRELGVNVALSTAVGWAGGAGIDKLFSSMPFSLDLGAVRPLLRPAAKKLASFTVFGTKQAGTQLISDGFDKVNEQTKFSERIGNFMHARGSDAVGSAED